MVLYICSVDYAILHFFSNFLALFPIIVLLIQFTSFFVNRQIGITQPLHEEALPLWSFFRTYAVMCFHIPFVAPSSTILTCENIGVRMYTVNPSSSGCCDSRAQYDVVIWCRRRRRCRHHGGLGVLSPQKQSIRLLD
jgi:hypothetical protein